METRSGSGALRCNRLPGQGGGSPRVTSWRTTRRQTSRALGRIYEAMAQVLMVLVAFGSKGLPLSFFGVALLVLGALCTWRPYWVITARERMYGAWRPIGYDFFGSPAATQALGLMLVVFGIVLCL
jgi:hypothetical protein